VGTSSDSHAKSRSGLILILGGSGFIGSRLAPLLLDNGWHVRIGDPRRTDIYPELWTECDVTDRKSIDTSLSGVAAVINLAAEHRDDVRPLSRYYDVNVEGARLVCASARVAGVQKIVFTSSVAVYGFQPKPVGEDGPFEPFNAYGRTKLEAEAVYRAWATEDAARTLVIVRPSVVFGEANRGNVYNLLHQIASGKFLMVGSGKNVKSMAYVGNVAAFLAHTLSMGPGVHIFNYLDGPDMDTNTLVEHIRKCLGKRGPTPRVPKSVAMAGGYLLDAVARLAGRTFPISAIRIRKFCESTQFRVDRVAQTGFVRPYSLSEGLARTIESEFPNK